MNTLMPKSLSMVIKASTTVLMLPTALSLTLLGCGAVPTASQHLAPNASTVVNTLVILGPQGQPIARAMTQADQCPVLQVDGQTLHMDVRVKPEIIPQRPTISDPEVSKPSAFPILTCEKAIPAGTVVASISGQALPLPKALVKRIVVIGDTGCRIKKSDHAYQACNNPEQYPFAQVAAQAAAQHPDLVIHVGDLLYRETPCPEGNVGCAGSPWGYGWDAWNADFFTPGRVLMQAAPWAMARGNHESCTRAGQGWWRFIDPRPLQVGRDCNNAANDDSGDYSDPYAVPIGGNAQLIMLDTANTAGKPVLTGDIREIKYRDMYHQMETLSQGAAYNIGVNHHPILGFTAKKDKQGNITLMPGNQGLQSVLSAINPLLLPPRVNAMLSGHVHLWQEVSFSTPHPTQFIAGFSGTEEDVVPLPETLPVGATPAVGAVVDHFSSWVSGFGFMTMERTSTDNNQWLVKVWDRHGKQVNTCHIDGKNSVCDVAQVK
ncbi:metallophosphoesterase family protein [Aquirhabdus sp.]|uniref:metallophosphoesterase family protein n=1 Tax=Aquirhabdus sp. TaxID=2824160 RepID=UPI00396CDFA1